MPIQLDEHFILPTQIVPTTPPSSEQRLVAAMLERAVDDLNGHGYLRRDYQRRPGGRAVPSRWRIHASPRESAREWIISDDKSWPLSFVNCCDQLGLNPELTRAALLGGCT